MVGHSKGYIEKRIHERATLKDAMLAAGYTGTRGSDDGIEDMLRVIGSAGYGCVLSCAVVFDCDSGIDIILAYEKDSNSRDGQESRKACHSE